VEEVMHIQENNKQMRSKAEILADIRNTSAALLTLEVMCDIRDALVGHHEWQRSIQTPSEVMDEHLRQLYDMVRKVAPGLFDIVGEPDNRLRVVPDPPDAPPEPPAA
jgi:hypothetical protein